MAGALPPAKRCGCSDFKREKRLFGSEMQILLLIKDCPDLFRLKQNIMSDVPVSPQPGPRRDPKKMGSAMVFNAHAHGNLNRYVVQICPELWQNWWGCLCCIDPLTQPPFKHGKFPDPPAELFQRGLTADAKGVAQDWLHWMQRLSAASYADQHATCCGGLACICSAIFLLPWLPLHCIANGRRRARLLAVLNDMNAEFLAPMHAYARLYHYTGLIHSGGTKVRGGRTGSRASWLAIGLSDGEIERMKGEEDDVNEVDCCFAVRFCDCSRCCGGGV